MNETDSQVETKICSNCETAIEKSKFMLHEAYCFRNMYKCKCGEVVLKAEKEEHEEEKHQEIQCKFCSFKAMKHEFGDHEENCDKKPKLCQFCENMIDHNDYLQHINRWGSRSRKCEFWQRNVMMRNQKYHEQEEWAKFIREEYEKEEKERIKALEEEEARKDRVKELQRQRRAKKNIPDSSKKSEALRKNEEAKRNLRQKPAPKNAGPSKRDLPSYYKGKEKASKPEGVAGRTRAKKSDVPESYYKPSTRSKRTTAAKKEDHKEISKRSKPTHSYKKPRVEERAPRDFPVDSPMVDSDVMNEIPPELLNQIYSEDLDEQAVKDYQAKEYKAPEAPPAAERLVDGGMDVDFGRPPPRRASPPPRRASPPPRRASPPPPDMSSHMPPPASLGNDNEELQKAIAASLEDNNLRQFPMSDDFDSTMNDPEMLEAIARSMQDN